MEARAMGPAIPESFRALYRDQFPFVWRSLRRLGVPEASLDDAAQEVFVVVFRRLAEFEGRSALSTWIFAIAIRVAREHVRRARARRQLVPLDGELSDPAAPSPFDAAQRADRARVLERLLAELEEERRIVFVLADVEGFTVPEIAASLELKLNTVYSRLRRARADFERALARLRAKEERMAR
jgi:RNA polymerase sigma-70 factor, ECF subfamily